MGEFIGLSAVVLPLFIPIFFLLIGMIIALAAIRQRARLRQMEHDERMLAIEKGVPLPAAAILTVKPRNPYLWGFVLLALGLGLTIVMIIDHDNWGVGVLLMLLGGALLLANWIFLKKQKRQEENLAASNGEIPPQKLS